MNSGSTTVDSATSDSGVTTAGSGLAAIGWETGVGTGVGTGSGSSPIGPGTGSGTGGSGDGGVTGSSGFAAAIGSGTGVTSGRWCNYRWFWLSYSWFQVELQLVRGQALLLVQGQLVQGQELATAGQLQVVSHPYIYITLIFILILENIYSLKNFRQHYHQIHNHLHHH